MYGKGIVGSAMVKLLEYMKYDFVRMDDADKDDTILEKSDKIIITAWISPQHVVYAKYSEKLMWELDLCYEVLMTNNLLNRVHFYCITGTNGKSTTTWIAYNTLRQLFSHREEADKVLICGNFEPAVSEVVLDIITNRIDNNLNYHLVTEISSFMCYQIKQFQSDYSIITNLAPDHLNRHPDLDDYYQTKIRLFDHTIYACITNKEVADYILNKQIHISCLILDYNTSILVDLEKTQFIGKHNAENFAAVYCLVGRIAERYNLERNADIFYTSIWWIEPLGNRCRKSLVVDGIQFIDDLHATGTHAQSAALSCVDGELILICGGKEAGEDYTVMKERYHNKVRAAVIIWKESLPFSPLFDVLDVPYLHTTDMRTWLLQAISYAKEYNLKTILYSPWAKSFDLFKNREDRALTFQKELKTIS